MQFYLISDNIDTQMGMRLVGIPGETVHEKEEVLHSLESAMQSSEIGILLITEKLAAMVQQEIDRYRRSQKQPLIVEVPDRHGGNQALGMVSRYVEEALGIHVS